MDKATNDYFYIDYMPQRKSKPYRLLHKAVGHNSPQMTLHYIQAIDTDLSDELSKLDDLI